MARKQTQQNTVLPADRNGRVEAILFLVGVEAARKWRACLGALPFEDMYSDGCLGAIQAVDSFISERGQQEDEFESLCAHARGRIQGAILDGLRERDHLSRAQRRDAKIAHAESPEGTMPVRYRFPMSVNQTFEDGTEMEIFTPHDEAGYALVEDAEEVRWLWTLVAKLTPRLRKVMECRYLEEMPHAEVGSLLGVTESRSCQLEKMALSRLRDLMDGTSEHDDRVPADRRRAPERQAA